MVDIAEMMISLQVIDVLSRLAGLWVSPNKDVLYSQVHQTTIYTYRVSKKKVGLVFRAHFRGLNGLKSKSGRPQTPIRRGFQVIVERDYEPV